MKNKKWIVGVMIALLATALAIRVIGRKEPEVESKKVTQELSHRQIVWIYALEWCESAGIKQALNPRDRDGTPSYGGFQFKPETFVYYFDKYKLEVPQLRADEISFLHYDSQKKILERMIFDKDVKWTREFPDCVKKLGLPPRN